MNLEALRKKWKWPSVMRKAGSHEIALDLLTEASKDIYVLTTELKAARKKRLWLEEELLAAKMGWLKYDE